MRTELIRPLPELIKANAVHIGDRLAFADAGRSVTHAELALRTARLAGHLAEHGLRPGGRAAVALPNGVDMVECCLAITRAGGICVPADPRAPADQLDYLLADSGATLVITDARGLPAVETTSRRTVLVTGPDAPGRRSIGRLATTDAPPPRDDLDLTEPAWLMYTSGTTGPPKGVLTSQRNCLWSVAACYAPILGLSVEDHLLCPLPLHHSLAQVLGVVGTIATGAAATLADGITADAVLDALRTGRHTFLVGAPSLYADLLRRADRPVRAAISRLRVCLSTGAIAAPALSAEFAETFGVPLLNSYGATETSGPITVSWTDGGTPGGSAGLPVPGLAVRVVDPTSGEDMPPGEEGEVLVRGPNLMLGYHDRPEASDDALRGGWYRTGDLACLDVDGHLRINGRLAELITTGGERTHPEEIEAVLRAVPGVADAAVVGRPHEVLGEIPVAFVAPGPAGFDQDRVLAACSRELPRAKVPAELFEIDAVPRSRSGKVARHRLHTLPAKLRAVGGTHYEQLFRLDWTPLLDRGLVTPGALRVAEFGEFFEAGSPLPDLVVLRAPADVGMANALTIAERVTTWLTHPWPPTTRLVVLTTAAVTTYPGERMTGLGGPALWGLTTAAQSDAADRLLVIDSDAELARETIAELGALGRPRLAVRGGIPLVPELARVSTGQGGGVRLRQPGTVLVTGGTSGLGREFAKHLVAAHGVRSLLLTTPTGSHPERFAADTLARPEVTVRTVAVDHADRTALAALLAAVPKDAPLTAVVHAAGLHPDGLLATAVAEDPAVALHRRITPAVHLHELTTNLDLAAFVLVSTSAGLQSGNTHAATAAVDACLGAIASIRHLTGQPTLSLSVGVVGETGLSIQETMAMFDVALRTGTSRLIAMRTPGAA